MKKVKEKKRRKKKKGKRGEASTTMTVATYLKVIYSFKSDLRIFSISPHLLSLVSVNTYLKKSCFS